MKEEAAPIQEQFKKCYLDAIRILTPKDYSEFKLKSKLRDREHAPEVIQEVIAHLIERKLFDPQLYTDARIRGLARKNLAPNFIKQKLNQEKINCPLEYIEEVLGIIHVTKDDQLENLIAKKARLSKVNDPQAAQKEKDKILRFLLSKGHSFDQAKKALNQFLESQT